MDFWIVAEIRQQAAQPALVDEKHAAAQCFFRNCILGLPLRSDKENCFSLCCKFRDELCGFLEQPKSLLQIDDVDSVTLTENVLLHLRIPALGLVTEMNAGFQKFLHCDRRQINLRFRF